MVPDYLTLIRYLDKRVLPFFYLILFIILGFYWKNNAYVITHYEADLMSVILAITLFNFIYDLKAYWVYSCKIERFDQSYFVGKNCSKSELFFSKPIVVAILSIPVFFTIIYSCLLLLDPLYSVLCLFLVLPLCLYLVYRCVRASYIKQILASTPSGVRYKTLYSYVGYYVVVNLIVNMLLISPLKTNTDFSLVEGFFCAKLMVAMLILCAIVLGINLIFSLVSKKYIFFGRIYANEIDFLFSKSMPFSSLYAKPFVIRMLFLLAIQFIWIIFISAMLSLLNWHFIFEGYFLVCFLPCMGYYFLHVYWRWHNDFMMSCDICFRYEEFKKYQRNIKFNQ